MSVACVNSERDGALVRETYEGDGKGRKWRKCCETRAIRTSKGRVFNETALELASLRPSSLITLGLPREMSGIPLPRS